VRRFIHYTKSTLILPLPIVGGVPFEVGTFNNDSPAAKLLESQLKQEESQSALVYSKNP
jgi:hypothetical protein